MKKLLFLPLLLITFQAFSQNNFYDDSNYVEAKNAFLKSDHNKFKKTVKKELSKPNASNIYIDLANKIITDIDPAFENELTTEQKEVAKFSREINILHKQGRHYDIFEAYRNCDFLEQLSPSTYYQIISSVSNTSYDDLKKIININLKSNIIWQN